MVRILIQIKKFKILISQTELSDADKQRLHRPFLRLWDEIFKFRIDFAF